MLSSVLLDWILASARRDQFANEFSQTAIFGTEKNWVVEKRSKTGGNQNYMRPSLPLKGKIGSQIVRGLSRKVIALRNSHLC